MVESESLFLMKKFLKMIICAIMLNFLRLLSSLFLSASSVSILKQIFTMRVMEDACQSTVMPQPAISLRPAAPTHVYDVMQLVGGGHRRPVPGVPVKQAEVVVGHGAAGRLLGAVCVPASTGRRLVQDARVHRRRVLVTLTLPRVHRSGEVRGGG